MLKKLYALKNKKGFTLVELMVVVAILGILVAVAVPVYNNSTSKAEAKTCAANIRTIESAITQAEVNGDVVKTVTNSKYTVTMKDKSALTVEALVPGYLQAVPQCPSEDTKTDKDDYTITVNADTGAITVACAVDSTNHIK